MRKSASDRSDNFDAAFCEIESSAEGNSTHNGDQRPRHTWGEPAESKDDEQNRSGEKCCGKMRLGQALKDFAQLQERMARMGFEAQHSAKHSDGDLKAHASEKSDKNRA